MIAIGADHAGFEYKEKIKDLLRSMGLEFKDFGTNSSESTDYPDYAHHVAESVSAGKAEYGILVCGTGIGMAIVANKHTGIRASSVESREAAKLAREHNDANVLAIGARLTSWDKAKEIITTFLSTKFEGGRHQRRVDKIHTLTNL
ncbi:MAG: ribose 5-phosphate isomerase B [Ignavibacteria bacterium]|nr:ribose 5-phosphate isomerase B [Ignavibacteria bacterium]MBI3766476.1 ribose 5-phosphate isomerase B [Ignavibacteriales bacterium]